MDREQVREKVIEVICEQLQVERDKLKDETSFIDDLGADSLDLAELAMEFEDEFDISIPEDDEGIKTVGQAVDLVMKMAE